MARINDVLNKYNPDEPRDAHGRWTAGSGPGSDEEGASAARPAIASNAAREPVSYTLTPAASDRVYPWVTSFRNTHLPQALKLAALIGHGATADEVLAVSAAEFDYGRDPKAAVHGNFFGIHSPGTDPSRFLPGQIGTIPTISDGPLATFPLASGFALSGSIFAKKMANHSSGMDFSNPDTFFALAHSLGWGVTNKGYLNLVGNAYRLLRNSARASERRA